MNCSFVGMNFLAHAYLSFENPEILVGNMISDFVKGKAKFSFNGKIQNGIQLHRDIDRFTDDHPATRKAMEFFRPHYRLYSGPIIDILYDHYLANDTGHFKDTGLQGFVQKVYTQLEQQSSHLPHRFLPVFSYMKLENWLYNYRTREWMKRSLAGLVRRAAYLSESDTAYNLFNVHYVQLQACYEDFFPDVHRFAREKFNSFTL